MKLENQICSLELAKRLKELGAKQESFFSWQWHCISGKWHLRMSKFAKDSIYPFEEVISAFTVTELGEILAQTQNAWYSGFSMDSKWFCEMDLFSPTGNDPRFYANIEANTRAKMLIYLLEKKLK